MRMQTIFNQNQIEALQTNKKAVRWSEDTYLKAMRMRLALGRRGFSYLVDSGFPYPSISSLNRRISSLNFDFGILTDILPHLKEKVLTMNEMERQCAISFDEMCISDQPGYDRKEKKTVVGVTLGDKSKPGDHLLMVLIRGISTNWKQIIAYEVTGPFTSGLDMKQFIVEIIRAVRNVGLKVCSITSDMGASNKALWASLGVCVSRSQRDISFVVDSADKIWALADVCHLLKNLWNCMVNNALQLDAELVQNQDLPSAFICHKFIVELFHAQKEKDLRLLHHLTEVHLKPDHFSKMHVGNAVAYFSLHTASALECAVSVNILPKEALTTAWFIRLIYEWFKLTTSRVRKTSITAHNYERKQQFLNDFVSCIQGLSVKGGWKPVQTGLIMSSLSILKLAEHLFAKGLQYVLTSRFTQVAVENTFSVMRAKAGKNPNALDCKSAVKLISISQFLKPLSKGNYLPEDDIPLLGILGRRVDAEDSVSQRPADALMTQLSTSHQNELTAEVELDTATLNSVYYIAGNCARQVSKHACSFCKTRMSTTCEAAREAIGASINLTQYANCGGLVYASPIVFFTCCKLESFFMQQRDGIINEGVTLSEFVVNGIVKEEWDEEFAFCSSSCNVKEKLCQQYWKVRSFQTCKHYSRECSAQKNTGCYSSRSVSHKMT